MYEDYWKLKEKPFENTPDPRFLYYSKQHEEGLMRLIYTVMERKGAAMLTGDYGTGKTLLSRALLGELAKNDSRFEVAVIVNPHLSPRELLQEVLFQLGDQDVDVPKLRLSHLLNDRMYRNLKSGKESVILVDEAQVIDRPEIFEELRLLLNFQLNERFLLTLILVGQPELREKVHQIPQLEQRMAVKFHLKPLDEAGTLAYVQHRLKTAGGEPKIFAAEACTEVFRAAEGRPRQINNLCDMALLVGMMERAEIIDRALMQRVVRDSTAAEPARASAKRVA